MVSIPVFRERFYDMMWFLVSVLCFLLVLSITRFETVYKANKLHPLHENGINGFELLMLVFSLLFVFTVHQMPNSLKAMTCIFLM